VIFWILIGAIALTVIITFYNTAYWNGGGWDVGDGLAMAGVGAIISALIAGLLFLVAMAISFGVTGWNYLDTWSVTKETHSLTALKTASSVEGRSYFLGGGYIDGKRVLDYIEAKDGAYYVKSSDADDSVIHEFSGKPYVKHEHSVGGFWWLAPFPLGDGDSHDFYVPEGSVLSDYAVDNG
jgi:uncharacterized membrane protein